MRKEDAGFLACVAELPGCMTDGTIAQAAEANVRGAIGEWIVQAEAVGRAVS
jgi:predicted RNase H-like HicB family nuclease